MEKIPRQPHMSIPGSPTVARARLRGLLVGVLLLAGVPSVHAEERSAGTTTAAALGSYAALTAIDMTQTSRCLHAGMCAEVNPALRGVVGSPKTFTAVKVAASTGLIAATWALHKRHPRAALWLAVGLAVGQAVVVTSNAYQVRRRS